MTANPAIVNSIQTGEFATNYHDQGEGNPVILLHGSGPGVTAYANWRLIIPKLAEQRRVIAPDMVGFGYTERPDGIKYSMEGWVQQTIDLMDALGIEKADLVGNSFGGGLALNLAIKHPDRIDRIVLMGSMGISFPITDGLDFVWGYTPSYENMEKAIRMFAYNHKVIATPDLIEARYQASIEPGFQESFGSMFPEPRQDGVEWMAADEEDIKKLTNKALIVHGREDQVIPLDNAYRLIQLLDDAQLHVFGQCGHWTQIEHAEEFAQLVNNFLNYQR